MTAQETNLLNAFETTLTGTIGASDLTFTVNSVTDSASNTLAAPCYLILNPDSATNREVVLVTSVNAGTKTLTLDNINKRYLTGSAATSGLSHASGSVVRMSPVQQHIEDINDRVDTIINEAGTAVNTSLFLDEDDMSSNSATKGVTQQSVKAYVDTQLTAEDLDISADSGSNIAIDLDSEVLDLEGGTGIDTTTGTNKVTFAIDSTVATLTGSQTLTSKIIDVDSNTVSNIEVDNLKSGVLDTDLSSVSGSDDTLASAKAIKSYVDTQITAEDLDITDGSTTSAVDLDSQTLTIQGTSNEVEVSLSSQTFTIGLPASITANLVGNVTGNVSGTSGSTTGNAATATALQTARNIGGVSFDGTANINLPGVNTAGNQDTSGNSATATALETARNIGGVSFDGTGNIDLPGVNTAGNQNTTGSSASTTGNAATATALQTARNIGGVSFDGTGNIDLPGVNSAGNQNTSGTAAGLSATLAVASGGTGATSMTDKAVVITQDSGTDTLSSVAMDANGELLIGGTSGPAVATLTAGDNITITNSDGGISIAAASSGGSAFSIIDSFELNGDLSGTGDITSFTDTANTSGAEHNLGSSMSESSGIFTFPETGIYLVEAWARIDYTFSSQVSINIQATTNNSSYSTIAGSRTNAGSGDDSLGVYPYCAVYVDVTDVSNVKVKFNTSGNYRTFTRVRGGATNFRFTKVANT